MSDPERGEGRDRARLVQAWTDSLRAAESDGTGPDETAAYVDGLLNAEDRALFLERLASDPLLRQEVRDLEELRDALARRPRSVSFRWVGGGLAAAAALILAVILISRPTDAPQEARLPTAPGATRPTDRLTVKDGARRISLTADGGLRGLEDIDAGLRGRVTEALRGGVLQAPPTILRLQGSPGTLMGAADSTSFALVAPVATAVRSDRPRFQWRAHPRARAYKVTVADGGLRVIARSPELTGTEWTPRTTLPRHGTYQWQVAALTPSGTEVAPGVGHPPAMFAVLSAEQAGDLERALAAAAGSHLAAAVLLAERGVTDEADRLLAGLASQNENDTGVVESLRRSLRPGR